MPTYQYACTACDERLEVVQKFTDDPLTECPACQGRLRKLFSAVGVVFKGSGFYRTDSRAAANGGSKTGGGKADGGTSDGGKTGSGEKRSGGSGGESAKPASGDSSKGSSSGASSTSSTSSTSAA